MEAMRLAAVVTLFALAGCSFAPGSRSGRVEGRPPAAAHIPTVADRHEFAAVDRLEAGRWARYRVARDGTDYEITLGVAAPGWIEVVEEGDPRRASLRHVTADGRVEKALFREAPSKGDPSAVVRQTIVQADAPARGEPPQSTTATPGQDNSIGRELAVTTVTLLFRDEELGREYREELVWCRDVPSLFAGSEHGGLVRRAAPSGKVQLVDFGTGYTPVIDVPKSASE